MKVISLPRGQGKTTQLIKMSAETGIPILVLTKNHAQILVEKAKELNLTIESVLFVKDRRIMQCILSDNNICEINHINFIPADILIDEVDIVLQALLGCKINTVTITETKDKNKAYDWKTQTIRNIETGKVINDNPQNAILSTLSKSLNSLLKKYDKMIDNGDSGGALNVLKNIEMIITVIRDITDNQTLSKVLNNLSECWNDLDNQDDVSKAFMGEKLISEFKECVLRYGKLIAIESQCSKENLYYNEQLACNIIDGCKDKFEFLNYKRMLNCKQYAHKTYLSTIVERNDKMNKEIK